jgi:hypothetical protein
MSEVTIPQDEEFKKLLREMLAKPAKWHEERARISVEGRKAGRTAKGRRTVKRSIDRRAVRVSSNR